MLNRVLRTVGRWTLEVVEGFPIPIEDVVLVEALGHFVTTNGTVARRIGRGARR